MPMNLKVAPFEEPANAPPFFVRAAHAVAPFQIWRSEFLSAFAHGPSCREPAHRPCRTGRATFRHSSRWNTRFLVDCAGRVGRVGTVRRFGPVTCRAGICRLCSYAPLFRIQFLSCTVHHRRGRVKAPPAPAAGSDSSEVSGWPLHEPFLGNTRPTKVFYSSER
jgi:hypothetical protein